MIETGTGHREEARAAARARRTVDGVLLYDKPTGVSSNAALQRVKRLYRARKAGHTGSLDPIASGLLPICFGQATKLSAYLLDADKYYRVGGRLGIKTETGDADGAISETRPVPPLDRAAVDAVLGTFVGEQMQLPPMYSALKHRGQRLYALARQGVEVEREPRPICIHALQLVDHDQSEARLVLEVRCSKGTYVRTLFEDIAAALDTCGHVTALRRLGVGPYRADDMVDHETLAASAEQDEAALDAFLLPVDSAVGHWPQLNLSPTVAFYLRRGQPVNAPGGPRNGLVRLYEDGGGFLGIGEVTDDGRVAPRRLLS